MIFYLYQLRIGKKDHRRYRQFTGDLLYDFHLNFRLVVHDGDIMKNNTIAGKHDDHGLMPVSLMPLAVGLVEISHFPY